MHKWRHQGRVFGQKLRKEGRLRDLNGKKRRISMVPSAIMANNEFPHKIGLHGLYGLWGQVRPQIWVLQHSFTIFTSSLSKFSDLAFLAFMAFMAFEVNSDFWFNSYNINVLCSHAVKALFHDLMLAFLVFLAFIGLLGQI